MYPSGISFALLALSTLALAQDPSEPQCTAGKNAFCSGDSLKTNYIARCNGPGTAAFGNCDDNLSSPYAQCYQSSPTAGDAQCVKDCSIVTDANGKSFYPVGCSTNSATSGAPATPTTAPASGSSSNSTTPAKATSTSATHSATMPLFSSGASRDTLESGSLSSLFFAIVGVLVLN